MPVTTVEKVTALSRDFGSQRRLAELGERRPVDLIRRGQAREVLDAITSERAGSFA
ncbi:MAG: hypothetical protein M3R46_06525 [Actinomycetota bacterium]|nr:hypothetical protein [Actinomycetota bacterium]